MFQGSLSCTKKLLLSAFLGAAALVTRVRHNLFCCPYVVLGDSKSQTFCSLSGNEHRLLEYMFCQKLAEHDSKIAISLWMLSLIVFKWGAFWALLETGRLRGIGLGVILQKRLAINGLNKQMRWYKDSVNLSYKIMQQQFFLLLNLNVNLLVSSNWKQVYQTWLTI